MSAFPDVIDWGDLPRAATAADENYELVTVGCLGSTLRARITRIDDQVSLVASYRVGGFSVTSERTSRRLTEEEWTQLRAALAIGFWQMPEENGGWGLDGEQWTFEGARDGHRHRVYRWSPRDQAVVGLGKMLSELSGLPLPADIP
jgi:hypothetical protein